MKKLKKIFAIMLSVFILIPVFMLSYTVVFPSYVYADEEFDIPNEIDGVNVGYYATWEAPMEWMLSNNSGTPNRVQLMQWASANGSYDSQGFWRVKDYYFVAVAPAFSGPDNNHGAMIGDHITFTMSDGTKLECIVIDTKGDVKGVDMHGKKFDYLNGTPLEECFEFHDPQGLGRENRICGYGHAPKGKDINILEFTGRVSGQPYTKLGLPNGTHVKSFCNHKTAKEFKNSAYYRDNLFNDNARPYGEIGVNRTGRAFGNGDKVSIQEELIGPIIDKLDLTNGSIFTTSKEEAQHRREINSEIYSSITNGISTNSNSYSLYDLYGPKLQYFQYLGEETVDLTLVDDMVSDIYNQKELSLTTDMLNYTPTIYLSTQVYKGRAVAITSNMLRAGYFDPRVQRYQNKMKLIAEVTETNKARFKMAVSQVVVSITNLFIGNKFFIWVLQQFNKFLETNFWTITIPQILKVILPLGFVFVIISVVSYAIKYARGVGAVGIRQILKRVFVPIFVTGLMYAILNNAIFFNTMIGKATTFVDQMFSYGIAEINHDDEIIVTSKQKDMRYFGDDALDNLDSTTEAIIWKTAIFQSWCEGMLGKKYEELYTQFSGKPASKTLRQDHEDIEKIRQTKSTDTNPHYDSATMTGDVVVDVGNGKQIRNWAAYLWSAQSIYHVDHSVFEESTTIETDAKSVKWPSAKTTTNANLYADLFRVIDAKMNISPQHYADGSDVLSYAQANGWETSMKDSSRTMLGRAALLLAIWPVLFIRVYHFLMLMILCIQLIFFCISEIFKEDTGLSTCLLSLKKHFIGYAYKSIQLFILITIYTSFVGKGSMYVIAYLILAYVITAITPRDILSAQQKARYQISRAINKRHADSL